MTQMRLVVPIAVVLFALATVASAEKRGEKSVRATSEQAKIYSDIYRLHQIPLADRDAGFDKKLAELITSLAVTMKRREHPLYSPKELRELIDDSESLIDQFSKALEDGGMKDLGASWLFPTTKVAISGLRKDLYTFNHSFVLYTGALRLQEIAGLVEGTKGYETYRKRFEGVSNRLFGHVLGLGDMLEDSALSCGANR